MGNFSKLNFTSASQPYYVLMSADETILNSPIQYTNLKLTKTGCNQVWNYIANYKTAQ